MSRRVRPNVAALIVLLATCLLSARPAFGWNDGGHMLTALVAWHQMSDANRAWAIALLERHPRFRQDFVDAMPPGLSDADRARWIFARAATWPDVARGF